MSYKPSGDLVTKDGRTSQYTAAGFTPTFSVHLDAQAVSAQQAFMIVDLSDTANWPHTETGHGVIEWLIIMVDPDSSYVGEVKLGFLSNVDGTNGDFHQVIDIDMVRKADIVVENMDFGTHGIEMELSSWFGVTIADSTLFQTDLNLERPDGAISAPSGNGDIVMLIERSAGSVDVSITVGYETAP